jgi:hypothetical protein
MDNNYLNELMQLLQGQGAMSDRDLRQFEGGLPGLDSLTPPSPGIQGDGHGGILEGGPDKPGFSRLGPNQHLRNRAVGRRGGLGPFGPSQELESAQQQILAEALRSWGQRDPMAPYDDTQLNKPPVDYGNGGDKGIFAWPQGDVGAGEFGMMGVSPMERDPSTIHRRPKWDI